MDDVTRVRAGEPARGEAARGEPGYAESPVAEPGDGQPVPGPPGRAGDPAPSRRLGERLRWRWGWVFAAVWLVFLTEPLRLGLEDPVRWRGALAVASVLAFSVLYVRGWWTSRGARHAGRTLPARYSLAFLGTQFTLALVACLTTGQAGLDTAPFLIVLTMMMLRPRAAVLAVAVLMVVVLGATEVVPGWHLTIDLASGLVLVAFIMLAMMRMFQRNTELLQQAELAVAQERVRFARDLHDVLGHSLTLLVMKAELAGRLVQVDPARAEAEIADVERLARDALVDVRAAVGGYRKATLIAELVAARAVLDAAGIEAELPASVDDVPGERRELLGWAVREGVTNVVRHSGARTCRVVVGRDGVEISDDGRGPDDLGRLPGGTGPVQGHGLSGLRERAEAAGASLLVGRSALGGFLLRVGW